MYGAVWEGDGEIWRLWITANGTGEGEGGLGGGRGWRGAWGPVRDGVHV